MKQPLDNFSQGGAEYAAFRPDSPDELFVYLYRRIKNFDTAWDCGTGNGQAAVKLAERFKKVYATDISKDQLDNAPQKDNIIYLNERAEETSIPDNTADLVTVAQALHWFDFTPFYKEVERIAKPGALFAAWTYTRLTITPQIDNIITHLYADITRQYWDAQRDYVDEEYKTIPFPFTEIKVPPFHIVKSLDLEQVAGYLRTWSGVQHYKQKHKKDPVDTIMTALSQEWGGYGPREVTWPVIARVGIIS
jgi:SAM-dependent methyltransferase